MNQVHGKHQLVKYCKIFLFSKSVLFRANHVIGNYTNMAMNTLFHHF